MNDEALVTMYWSRNEDAIAQTAKQYGGYLTRIAGNILSDYHDTEECVNDTYLRTWNSIPTNRPQRLALYLGKICRQLAIDLFRRKNAQKRGASQFAASLEELSDTFSDGCSAEDAVQTAAMRETISRFVSGLPEDARRFFVGRYYYFDSVREIAAYCGVAEGTVKSSLFRSRKALKTYLIGEGYDV